MKNPRHCFRCPGRDLNRAPPAYESRDLSPGVTGTRPHSWKLSRLLKRIFFLILWRAVPLRTPFGLVILFITNSLHVTTIIHNYFLCRVTSAQLTNTHASVTEVTYNTLTRLHSLRDYTLVLTALQSLSTLLRRLTTRLQLLWRIIAHTLHLNTSLLFPRTIRVGLLPRTNYNHVTLLFQDCLLY
jgi:hypothetical protein